MDADCAMDALLFDVVKRGEEAYQDIRYLEKDPKKAWLDGYVAGCSAILFGKPPIESTQEERVCEFYSESAIL